MSKTDLGNVKNFGDEQLRNATMADLIIYQSANQITGLVIINKESFIICVLENCGELLKELKMPISNKLKSVPIPCS